MVGVARRLPMMLMMHAIWLWCVLLGSKLWADVAQDAFVAIWRPGGL